MEEDGEETPRSPFWLQSTTNVRLVERYRRRVSSFFFNSGFLILLLLFLAAVSMLFIIPSVISYTSQVFRPNFVKKSWDSINLVLVLFALAFGFLSRNVNVDDRTSFPNGYHRSSSDLSAGAPVTSPSTSTPTPHQWYDFPDQPIIRSTTGLRRHRSSSSYPDLRELSPPWNHRAADTWRFSDDTHLNSYRVLDYDRHHLRHLGRGGEQDSETKNVVHVDTFVDLPKEDSYTPPPQPPSPPPQPPAPMPLMKKPEGVYHSISVEGVGRSNSEPNKIFSPETVSSVKALSAIQDSEDRGRGESRRGERERRRARSSEPKKILSPEIDPVPEPSSPTPELPSFQDFDLEQKSSRSEKKRGGATATKEFFTSFYHKKKKKRQRHKSVDNLESLLHYPQQPPLKFQPPPPSPPPPPPPPPPPSVLHNLFTSKKEKRKKILSASPAPRAPPPPPPPPPVARGQRPTTTRVAPFTTDKPRLPVKMSSFYNIDDSSSGGESPLRRIPPPPPLPPFKMPDWKFTVEGDYVRLQSAFSSRSGSPEGDEAQSPSSDVDAAAAAPLFCPSPDVDTKADTFIARFRAGLKLEKINSFDQKQGLRMSNLGPGPGPSQF